MTLDPDEESCPVELRLAVESFVNQPVGRVVVVVAVVAVVAGNPLAARSDPITTTTSSPVVLPTGTPAPSAWTAVVGTPSSEATNAASGCHPGP
jgi:hypothetical protein